MSDSFENLLARTEHRDARPAGPCPDAGMLAAYLDATLTPSERAGVEAHAADCARCALQLATLVRLEDVSGSPQHARAPRWRRRMAWMVPAATAVLVGAVYVALPSPDVAPQRSEKPALHERPELKETQAARPAGGKPLLEASRYTVPPMDTPAPVAGSIPAAAPAPAPMTGTSRREGGLAATEERSAGNAVAPNAEITQGELQRKFEDRGAAPTEGLRQRTGVEPDSVTLHEAAKRADGKTPLVIHSPEGGVQWRVVEARIERSTDGGRTWLAERAPAPQAVTMGAAPSAEVCWMAAATGQVLRRTEGGSWADVSPALRLSIVRLDVKAPLEASVVGADGTLMKTTDGGRTWVR